MKLLGQTVLALAIFGSIKAQNQDNCHTYAAGACRDTSDHWSAQGFLVKVPVLWSLGKIETQNYDFFESYVYASLCLRYYLDWIFDYFLLDGYSEEFTFILTWQLQ